MLRVFLVLAFSLAIEGCQRRPAVPIFLWHGVGPEEGGGDHYDLDPAELDAELTLLDRYGAVPITLDALFDAREHGRKLPPRAVVLTFDDGRQGLYTYALPLLQKHHAVAEAFVVSSFLGADDAHRVHQRDATGVHAYLTWPELEAMVKGGTFVVESHSVTHPRLPALPGSSQRDEMTVSAQALRTRLQAPVHFFAYPFGASTWRTRLQAREAGYRGALSVSWRLGGAYALPRVSIRKGAQASFQRALEEAFGPLPGTGESSPEKRS